MINEKNMINVNSNHVKMTSRLFNQKNKNTSIKEEVLNLAQEIRVEKRHYLENKDSMSRDPSVVKLKTLCSHRLLPRSPQHQNLLESL